MKVKFIYSKKGYGKTKYILKDIGERSDSNIILLVPSHNTFMIENRVIDYLSEEIFSRLEIMDFKKLTSRILYSYSGFTRDKISDVGKNLLLNYILRKNSENISYFKYSSKMDFSDEILKVLISFKNYNFTDEKFINILTKLDKESDLYKKLSDFKILNDSYEDYLSERYLDPLDEMKLTNQIITKNNEILKDYSFYIDGFEIFTYDQYDFLNIMFNRAKEINISLTIDKDNNLIYKSMIDIKDKIYKILYEKGFYDIEEIYLDDSNKSIELKHLDNNYLSYFPEKYFKDSSNIYIQKSFNNFTEIEDLCKSINRLIINKNFRYKDIAILCRNIEDYEHFIRVNFENFNIPFFIDKRNDVKSNIFVIFLISIFEVFKYNFSYDSMFKYIKSGLLDILEEDIFIIENFCLENDIRGYKWQRDFNKTNKIKFSIDEKENQEKMSEYIDRLNHIRIKVINPIVSFFNKVRVKNNVNYFIKELYRFLDENLILNKLKYICNKFNDEKEFIISKELNQTVNLIFKSLDDLNSVFKDEVMDFNEFGEILLDAISKIEILNVPSRIDEVIIGDISRLSIGNYKALFVIGATFNNFPKKHKTEELISDMEKCILKNYGIELSLINKDKTLNENYLMYSLINIPKEYLYISYPISDMENKSLMPSSIIFKIKNIFVNLEEVSSKIVSKEFNYLDIGTKKSTINDFIIKLNVDFKNGFIDPITKKLYNFYKNDLEYFNYMDYFFRNISYNNKVENIGQYFTNELYSDFLFSVSSVETYAKCPFKYFLDYVMRIKKRKLFNFEPIDSGNVLHHLMETICFEINKDYDFRNLSRYEIKNIVDNYFEKNIFNLENEGYILNSDKKFKNVAFKIRKIVHDTISYVALQLSNSEFIHKFYEFKFGDNNFKVEIPLLENKKALFKGKIDRVDFCKFGNQTLVNIVDYKSSYKKIEYGKIYQGLNIQLIAYMKYIIDIYGKYHNLLLEPCGIFYFKLHSPIIKNTFSNMDKEKLKEYKYEGILTSDIDNLSLIDKNLLNNDFTFLPVKLKKDSNFDKKTLNSGRILNKNEFSKLLDFTDNSIKKSLENIFTGYIDINPVLDSSCTRCENCDYIGVCKFSKNLNSYRESIELDKDSFFELIDKGDFYELK